MTVPLLSVRRFWTCPRCLTEDVTNRSEPHTQMHNCPGLGGLTAPMVPAGTKAKHEAREREDYINGDDVPLHEGRPVMSIVTTRDDGEDCTVYAPTATFGLRSN